MVRRIHRSSSSPDQVLESLLRRKRCPQRESDPCTSLRWDHVRVIVPLVLSPTGSRHGGAEGVVEDPFTESEDFGALKINILSLLLSLLLFLFLSWIECPNKGLNLLDYVDFTNLVPDPVYSFTKYLQWTVSIDSFTGTLSS